MMEKDLENQFVPYRESLEIKGLGFDEPCFGCFNHLDNSEIWMDRTYTNGLTENITAPTFSQAFDFFETKYGIYRSVWPEFYIDGINFNWQCLWYLPVGERTEHVISGGTMQYGDNGEYPTRRLANIACINKMIEIVKNGKNE